MDINEETIVTSALVNEVLHRPDGVPEKFTVIHGTNEGEHVSFFETLEEVKEHIKNNIMPHCNLFALYFATVEETTFDTYFDKHLVSYVNNSSRDKFIVFTNPLGAMKICGVNRAVFDAEKATMLEKK